MVKHILKIALALIIFLLPCQLMAGVYEIEAGAQLQYEGFKSDQYQISCKVTESGERGKCLAIGEKRISIECHRGYLGVNGTFTGIDCETTELPASPPREGKPAK